MPETDMPLKCDIYATFPNYLMFIYGGSMPIDMPYKKSL